jgi:hypothetical protein
MVNISSIQILDAFKEIKSCHIAWYILSIVGSAAVIRAIISLLKAKNVLNENKLMYRYKCYIEVFYLFFFSVKRGNDISDCWLPTIIGLFELTTFPILISLNGWTFIGAWIGLKTVSLFGRWQEYRTAFNFFLVGNILSIVFSFLIFVFILQGAGICVCK